MCSFFYTTYQVLEPRLFYLTYQRLDKQLTLLKYFDGEFQVHVFPLYVLNGYQKFKINDFEWRINMNNDTDTPIYMKILAAQMRGPPC